MLKLQQYLDSLFIWVLLESKTSVTFKQYGLKYTECHFYCMLFFCFVSMMK